MKVPSGGERRAPTCPHVEHAVGRLVTQATQGSTSPLPYLLVGSAALRVGVLGAALLLPGPRATPAATAAAVGLRDALRRAA